MFANHVRLVTLLLATTILLLACSNTMPVEPDTVQKEVPVVTELNSHVTNDSLYLDWEFMPYHPNKSLAVVINGTVPADTNVKLEPYNLASAPHLTTFQVQLDWLVLKTNAKWGTIMNAHLYYTHNDTISHTSRVVSFRLPDRP